MSVTSALKRARASLRRQLPASGRREPPPPPGSAAEQRLVHQLTRAYDTGAVDDLVGLLAEDVLLAMPPVPLEFQGRELATQFLVAVVFRPGNVFRLVATRANGQPAFGMYLRDPRTGIARANGLMVFTLGGGQISAMIRFAPDVLPRFGLPAALPD